MTAAEIRELLGRIPTDDWDKGKFPTGAILVGLYEIAAQLSELNETIRQKKIS
jgi:hypothetical protein